MLRILAPSRIARRGPRLRQTCCSQQVGARHRSLAELGVVAMVPLVPRSNLYLKPEVARDSFERLTTAFVEAFSNFTGRTPHEIRDAMRTNHSFMGSTARDFGFVDLLCDTSTG